jgi:alkaline phosphatase D
MANEVRREPESKPAPPVVEEINRRRFLEDSPLAVAGALAALQWHSASGVEELPPHQAMGTKVGEVSDSSAIAWTRLTAAPERNNDGIALHGPIGRKEPQAIPAPVEAIEGACPGAPGRVRVRYGTREDLSDAMATAWADVAEPDDFHHQFRLSGLCPATVYSYSVETTGPGGSPRHGAFRGKFKTAPLPDAPAEQRFCVMTCQAYHDRDHKDGHNIYPAMGALDPDFVVFTGDNVYYDSERPRAESIPLARHHWQRMFSLPRQVELLRNVASYWEKDDHDTVDNDSWPGWKLGDLTFAQGQAIIFRQQVPLGAEGPSYRTFRRGRDLQIWLTDGRDFRSPNNQPDGPKKTIWGAEQKEWLKRTLKESDATWKVLISPTPLVGPDRENKSDNHANRVFQHEGDEIRGWFRANVPENFFVICGDRHWQFHSVHPETGLNEFSVGPASDAHASGTPGEDRAYHRFHRVKGGFLSVTVRADLIRFQHRDVHGAVVYTWSRQSAKPT